MAGRNANAGLNQLRAAFVDSEFTPDGGPVELRETHISLVFLTSVHAYKVLKPVRFEFLDFSTLDARKEECENEVRLNRRLAADVYLDVVPITETDGRLQLGGDGRVVEWAIRMRRLPDDATLQSRIENETASETEIDRILDILLPFFQNASQSEQINASADTAVIRRNLVENLDVLDRSMREIECQDIAVLRSAQLQFLATQTKLFEQRVRDGWIRDGHGDLRAEHIYFTEPPAIVDCIAFNDRFRHVDVLDEICFLATDLQRLGRDDLAKLLIEKYRTRMNDPAPDSLAAFFASYRFAVRAKVACLRASELPADERDACYESAAALSRRAHDVLQKYHRPCLITFCGLSGSGKSTIARRLATEIGAVHIASDVVRKELFGIAPNDHAADPRMYSVEMGERTYRTMQDRAKSYLQRGATVILDATFQQRAERDRVCSLPDNLGVPFLLVECRVPATELRQRLIARHADGRDVSDADVDVLQQQLQRFEPPDEIPEEDRLILTDGQEVAAMVGQIVSRLPVV